MRKTRVCHVDDVPPGEMKGFDVAGKRVLVLHSDEGLRACTGVCPHQEVLLEEGIFDGTLLTCHSHLWQWDVTTGEIAATAECQLPMYATEADEDGQVYVSLPLEP